MGSVYGPNMVTDSLQVYFDAGNVQSYPGSGNTWFDISGNGNDGTISGATYNSGDGGHFIFDGVDDTVVVDSPPGLRTYSTIGIWFKSTQASGEDEGGALWDLAMKGLASYDFIDGFRTYIDVNNDIVTWGLSNDSSVGSYDTGRSDYYAIITGSFASDSTWHYHVISFNGGTSAIYLDGVLKYNENVWGWEDFDEIVGSADDTRVMRIGVARQYNWFGFHHYRTFDGKINGVQLYHKALTAAEVLQNYNSHKSRYGL